jgi:hypothetical protein
MEIYDFAYSPVKLFDNQQRINNPVLIKNIKIYGKRTLKTDINNDRIIRKRTYFISVFNSK